MTTISKNLSLYNLQLASIWMGTNPFSYSSPMVLPMLLPSIFTSKQQPLLAPIQKNMVSLMTAEQTPLDKSVLVG